MEAPQPVIPEKPAVEIGSFEDFVAALPETQIRLKSDLERYVRLVSFKRGAISVNITDPRQNSLIGKIVSALQDMTGDLWIVSPSEEIGAEPISHELILINVKLKYDTQNKQPRALHHTSGLQSGRYRAGLQP